MIPALQYLKMPRTAEERREKFQLKDKPLTRQVLLDYMMDLLLLPYRSARSPFQAYRHGEELQIGMELSLMG